jgi:hypothetical protein
MSITLPTPIIKPVYREVAGELQWNWELQQDWFFHVRVAGATTIIDRRIEAGFCWDGSTKPLHNKAIFVTASSHWSMVVPSMEHDELCKNRVEVKAMGITSADAAWHFYQQCLAYKTGYAWTQWKAVLWGGPQW